jgi:hypothetical protein
LHNGHLKEYLSTARIHKVKGSSCFISSICKGAFGSPAQILKYLGQYTHKTAITAHRIKKITGITISFAYGDYANGNPQDAVHKQKEMTLGHEEFARRFEQHVLPRRFVKIRHGGYLAHNGKKGRIAAMHRQLDLPRPMPRVIIPLDPESTGRVIFN